MKRIMKTAVAAVMLAALMLSCASGTLAVQINDLGGRLYTSAAGGAGLGISIRKLRHSDHGAMP